MIDVIRGKKELIKEAFYKMNVNQTGLYLQPIVCQLPNSVEEITYEEVLSVCNFGKIHSTVTKNLGRLITPLSLDYFCYLITGNSLIDKPETGNESDLNNLIRLFPAKDQKIISDYLKEKKEKRDPGFNTGIFNGTYNNKAKNNGYTNVDPRINLVKP